MLTAQSLRKLCDVEFLVDSEPFPAHRVVVAAASPVFVKMPTNGMKETGEQEISINDIDKATWRLALDFMYTGCVEIQNGKIASTLARFADEFQMTALLSVAECYFCGHFSSDTVFSLYRLAEECCLKTLKIFYERKLEKEHIALSTEEDFKLLPFKTMDDIPNPFICRDWRGAVWRARS